MTYCSSSKEKDDQQLLIKINPEYSKLVNPLSNAEYDTLKNSIKEDGLHYPIIINSKGELLDGHHRYKISKELDLPISHEIKFFKDLIEEKKFVIDINLKRRQLNDFQKAELAYKLAKIESEKARLRQLSKLKDVKEIYRYPHLRITVKKVELLILYQRKHVYQEELMKDPN